MEALIPRNNFIRRQSLVTSRRLAYEKHRHIHRLALTLLLRVSVCLLLVLMLIQYDIH